MRYHLLLNIFGKMVKIKKTSFPYSEGIFSFSTVLAQSPMHLSSLLYISHTVDSYGHVCRQQMHSHKKLKENIAEHFLSLALLLS